MSQTKSASAVVIGGGVIGLSAAYELARRKFGRVVLLEKETIGDGASSRAGGIITGLLWSRTGVAARQVSLSLFRERAEDLAGYGYRYHDVGCLNLFDAASWPEREALLPLYDELGAPYEIVVGGEIHRRWPALTPSADIVGLFDPLGGYSEPHHYLPAMVRRCRDLGVEIREKQPVTGFVEHGGRINGVLTAEGAVAADVVICTVHTWTPSLLAGQAQLPVKAFVHQRYVTGALAEPPVFPAVNANPYGGYVRPADGGRILAGIESAEREEFPAPSIDFRMSGLDAPTGLEDRLRRNLSPLVPALAKTKWESAKVGLLSFSMDGEPVLGQSSQLPGLILGLAFHSGGFAYNPVAGLLLAELAATGKTSLDISAFVPDRFEPALTAAYLAQIVPQREAVARRH